MLPEGERATGPYGYHGEAQQCGTDRRRAGCARSGTAEKGAEDAAQAEQKRKNAALLNTYSNERDIDEARERALAANEQAIQQVEQRIAEAEKRRKELAAETEFYAKKPMPLQLKRDTRRTSWSSRQTRSCSTRNARRRRSSTRSTMRTSSGTSS